MHPEPASSAFLSVAYRPDSGLLIGRWLRSIAEAQLREGYEAMRQAAHKHSCHHWLMDARRRTDRRLNGPEWVVTHFLPQVQQEMSAPLCVAFLVLPNHLREVEADPTLPVQTSAPGDLFQFARFIDEGAANTWLDLQRRKE